MNLTLDSTTINFIGVSENGENITIEDNVGFSTADLDSGFNYSDASPMFQDGSAVDYPDTSEVVFFLQAWHIPFVDDGTDDNATGTALTVTRVRDPQLTAITTAVGTAGNFVYGDNLNEWTVNSVKDGWIKLNMFALDIVNTTSDAYYYDTGTNEIKRTSDDAVTTDLDTVRAALTQVAELNLLKTSKLDENIAYVERCYTMAKMRGDCKDEDEWRKHIMTLQTARLTAKIEFDSYGNLFVAQQLIEHIESYINRNNLEKPNT